MDQENPVVENSTQTKQQKGSMGLVMVGIVVVVVITVAFLLLQKTNLLSQKSTTSQMPVPVKEQTTAQSMPVVPTNEDLAKDTTELDGENLDAMDQELNLNDKDVATF